MDTPPNEPHNDGSQRPDFDELFLVDHGGSDSDADLSGGWFTPRLAARLWLAAELLADEYPGDTEAYEQRLPAIARDRGDAFAARLRQAASELRDDIEAGRAPTPRSTGEAVVLGWIMADVLAGVDPDDPSNEQVAELVEPLTATAHDTDDPRSDVSGLYDLLFDDLDFETLYSPELDGIDAGELGDQMGMESLRPADWFIPYPHLVDDLPARPEYAEPDVPLVFTLEAKVSFRITDPQAVHDAAVAFMAGPDTYFSSAQARQDEITRVQLSLRDALATLVDVGRAIADIPGAQEGNAEVSVEAGDTVR